MMSFPPSVSQVPDKYLCFLVTRVSERNVIDPEHVMLALTRLKNGLPGGKRDKRGFDASL